VTKKVAIEQTAWQKLTNQPIEYKTVTETKTVAYPIYKTTTERVQNCFTFEDYYPGDKYVDIM
jgi:beta-mannanase